jgi:hypothetical protein
MKTQITSDGKTVWVNSGDGSCIGRFSHFGIDIHRDFIGQMSGEGQCLECKKGPATLDDWLQFQAGMMRHYGVKIAKRHMPRYLRLGKV